jgi:hypothetical protein
MRPIVGPSRVVGVGAIRSRSPGSANVSMIAPGYLGSVSGAGPLGQRGCQASGRVVNLRT